MSDSMGAMFGAQLIADSLYFQRLAADRRHSQSLDQLAADNALIRQQWASLVQRYNQLIDQHNELIRRVETFASDYDKLAARNVGLQEQVRTLQETVRRQDRQAELDRLRMYSLDLRIKGLHQMERERDPDAFPVDDE